VSVRMMKKDRIFFGHAVVRCLILLNHGM